MESVKDGVIINGTKHILVKSDSRFYCNDCSLRDKCLLRRFPCQLFGALPGWHFEIEEEVY